MSARPGPAARPPERILAIRLQAFGDTVLTLPYLNALRRALPQARLDFLTRAEVASVPKGVDLFDRVHEIPFGRRRRWQMMGAAAVLPRLLARRYQVVIDLQANGVSRFVRRTLRPPAWSEFDRTSPSPAGERTRIAIEAAGCELAEVRAGLTQRRVDSAGGLLRDAGWDGSAALIVLNPAGAFAGRSWPLNHYARFAQLWSASAGAPVTYVVLGFPSMAAKAAVLAERIGPRLLSLVGRTTGEQALDVVRRAALVLSEDSGLMHLAWAAGRPTFGLLGASRGAWSRPHGAHSAWIGACREEDGACVNGRCHGEPNACLASVEPEEVVRRARDLVRRAASGPPWLYREGRPFVPPPESISG